MELRKKKKALRVSEQLGAVPDLTKFKRPTTKAQAERPAVKKIEYISSAAAAELVGGQFLDWKKTVVVTPTGTMRDIGGNFEQGPQYGFTGKSDNGNVLDEMFYSAYYPLVVDTEAVKRVLTSHEETKRRLASKTSLKRVKYDDEGNVVAASTRQDGAPRKPREGSDPKTGCQPSSSAHKVGTIMLDTKPGPEHRVKSVERLVKELGMEKPLAQSWYSTLFKRKAEIYGKLQEGK